MNAVTLPQYVVQTQEFPEVDDYDELREANGVALVAHATSVEPLYLQVLDAGVYKGKQAVMSASTLEKETIEGYESFAGIAHLKALAPSKNFTLSSNVCAHPSILGTLEFILRHWKDYYKIALGLVLYVYVIKNRNPVFPLFYQTRSKSGSIGRGCKLLCKFQPSVEKPVLSDACIQVTIGSCTNDHLGSSEFRLIRNNRDMAYPIDILLQLQD